MIVPFTTEKNPFTGIYNAKFGVWLFLASEVMLFGGLFSAYVLLRVGNPAWPEGASILNIPLATLNTFILISSSVTMVMTWASLKLNNPKQGRMWLAITLLCACGFLIVKYFEYSAKFSHGLLPSTNNFLGMYFVLTGLHGLHVVGGMVVLGYLLGPGWKMLNTNKEQFINRTEVVGLYWHFVDLVWIFLFPVLYLL